jgi:crotonobetainyl-CoA:carnitine CoA-transferase CaiB-like acyl-CoA transferase
VLATWVGPFDAIEQRGLDEPMAGAPGYGVFRTADDRYVALGITNEDRFWTGLCRALDLEGQGALALLDRQARTAELNALVAERLARLTADDALDRLAAADVPASAVLSRAEMLRHPHFRERGVIVDGAGGAATTGPLARFLLHPAQVPSGAPDLDAHGGEGWRPR